MLIVIIDGKKKRYTSFIIMKGIFVEKMDIASLRFGGIKYGRALLKTV